MSASRTFAESSGFEPLHRINDDSLAGHYITALSTLQNIFCGERELNPEPFGPTVFKTASSTIRTLSIVGVIRFELIKPEGNGVTDRYNSPTLPHSLPNGFQPGGHILFCGNRMIRTFIRRLTTHCSTVELYFLLLVRRDSNFDPRIKSPVHLPLSYEPVFVMTDTLELSTTIVSG